MQNYIKLVAAVNYRDHLFYIYEEPELTAFNWLVVVNSRTGGLVEAGVHWVSCREDAELWGRRVLTHFILVNTLNFLKNLKKLGKYQNFELAV